MNAVLAAARADRVNDDFAMFLVISCSLGPVVLWLVQSEIRCFRAAIRRTRKR